MFTLQISYFIVPEIFSSLNKDYKKRLFDLGDPVKFIGFDMVWFLNLFIFCLQAKDKEVLIALWCFIVVNCFCATLLAITYKSIYDLL